MTNQQLSMTNDSVNQTLHEMVRALSAEVRTVRGGLRVVEAEMREAKEAISATTEVLQHIMQPIMPTHSLDQPPSTAGQGDPNSERDANQHPVDWYSEAQVASLPQADTDFIMSFTTAFPPSYPPLDQPDTDGSPYQFPMNPPSHGSAMFESRWSSGPGTSQPRRNDSAYDSSSQANLDIPFAQGSSRGQTARETREVWEDDWDDGKEAQGEMD